MEIQVRNVTFTLSWPSRPDTVMNKPVAGDNEMVEWLCVQFMDVNQCSQVKAEFDGRTIVKLRR